MVEPVLESTPGDGPRTKTPVATLTVLSGEQAGVAFIVVQGGSWAVSVDIPGSGAAKPEESISSLDLSKVK